MNNLITPRNRRLLVTDDNRAIHDDFRKILSPGNAAAALDAAETELFGQPTNGSHQIYYEIDSAYQGQDGVLQVQQALAAGRPYALAFVDVRMPPGMDGVETVQKIWAVDPEIQIVLCTAYADYSWDEMVEKLGNSDGLVILKKPFDPVEALQLAQALTEKWWLHRQSRKKMEELEHMVIARTGELQRQQTELRALFDYLPAMICFKDTANVLLRVNKRLVETVGKSVEEVEGKPTSEIFPQEAAKFYVDDLEVIRSGTPKLGILETVQDRQGKELWLQTDKVPVFDQDRKVVGLVVMAQDITERKLAEEELQWKTAFLEAQVNSSLDGIIVVDQQGKKILQNQRTADLFKIPPHIAGSQDDAEQVRWVTNMTRHPQPFAAKVIHLYSHPDEISRDEIELKEGTILDRYSAPVVGRDGKCFGRIWTFRDITEGRRIEQELKQAKIAAVEREGAQRYSFLADAVPLIIWTARPDGGVNYYNKAWSDYTGLTLAQSENRGWEALLHPEDLPRCLACWAHSVTTGENYEIEYRFKCGADGTYRWFLGRATARRSETGEIVQWVGTATDVDDQKRAHSRLEGVVAERTSELVKTNEVLQRQQTALLEAKYFLRATLNALSSHIAILDERGAIIEVNAAWNRFANENTVAGGHVGTGENYLKLCDAASGRFSKEAPAVAAGIRAVIAGQTGEFHLEYPCHSPTEQRWFIVRVTRFGGDGPVRIVVAHESITERKLAETALLDSRALYHSLVEHISAGMFRKDGQGRYTFVNARFCQLKDLQAGEILGKTPAELAAYEGSAAAGGAVAETVERQRQMALQGANHHEQIMRTGRPIEVEEVYFQPDGTARYFQVLKSPVFGADGEIVGTQGIQFDITPRKQAEAALRESNEKFNQLAENITDVFWIRSPDLSKLHYVSPAFERIWGRSVASLQADPQQWINFILPEDRERVERAFDALKGDTRSLEIEYRITRPDGEIRWVHVRGFQVRNTADQLIRHAGIATDFTERKSAEAKLARTEELYRRAISAAEAVPYSSDYRTKSYLFMGAGIEQLIGYTPHEVSGQLWQQIIEESVMGGEAVELTKDEAARRMMTGELRTWRCDMRVRTRSGKSRWLSDTAVQHFDDAGRPAGSMGILQDITERKQAEISSLTFAKLGQRLSSATSAREAFAMVAEVSQELFGWDAFCIYLYSAKSDSIYLGLNIDTIEGKQVSEDRRTVWRPSELYRRIMEQGGELILRDTVATPLSGTIPFGNVMRPSASLMFVPILSQGRPVGILSVQSYTFQAYTRTHLRTLQTMADQCGGAFERIWADEALRTSEAQLFQSQKLETVGKLAGGIAHEFNSILTAIIGQSELLLGDLPAGSALTKNATEIIKAANRAATLTRQLLAYGRKQFLQPQALNLNQVIASMDGVLRHLMGGEAVAVNFAPAAGLQLVKVDAGQMEQVIMNLVLNARDAMPNGGKLTLETANVIFDAETVGRYPELKPGEYVMLAFSDTGTGMSAEVQARVFEPFFTTKGVGQGSGLGLSTCYGIIKQSGGHISIYSEPGRGTTFKIYLPQIISPAKVPVLQLDSPDLPSGTESILLVEDDPALREMAANLLRRLGYTVFAAANGVEALSLKNDRTTGHIDLLFTDVVMPHMSGKELADRMQVLNPHIKILFTSAYTENAIIHQGVLDKGVALLPKPFTPSALARKGAECWINQTSREPPCLHKNRS